METRVHREPSPTGYRLVTNADAARRLVPLLAPELAVTLNELELP
jgi:hypothetical protein